MGMGGMDVGNIIRAIDSQNYYITNHADEEAEDDQLELEEIFYSVRNGEIIKDYPEDRPHSSCLIYGKNIAGEPIHSVWAYDEENQRAILITVYRPDPTRWINWRERRTE